MTEYTLDTRDVRGQWGNAVDYHRSPQQRLRGFDRWLSELIRKEREEAVDHYAAQVNAHIERYGTTVDVEPWPENPYRKEQS